MKIKFVACVLGLLSIGGVGSLEASSIRGNVGLTVTGQTECWDGSGSSIPCAGTGQDGEYQKGWTTGTTPRFKDNLDGTVSDRLTGLTWLKNADCFGPLDWTSALSAANGLAGEACGLAPSAPDDWRLPNLRELQSLIDYQNAFPALPAGHPFSGVQSIGYWSSTSGVGIPFNAWYVDLDYGFVFDGDKTFTGYVWPVRGGQ